MELSFFENKGVKYTLWKYAKLLSKSGYGDYEDSLSELRCKVLEGFKNFNSKRSTAISFACVIIKTRALNYLKKQTRTVKIIVPFTDSHMITTTDCIYENSQEKTETTLLLDQIEKDMWQWFVHRPCRYFYAVSVFKLLRKGFTKSAIADSLEVSNAYIGSIFKDIKNHASNCVEYL